MKSIFKILVIIIVVNKSFAQQIPYLSQINEARSFWNPAMTASGTSINADLFVRQQWLGFKGAPTTGFINYQYPFVDNGMSAGGAIVFDNTGPLTKVGAQLSYAYKLEEALGNNTLLALGISAGGHSYRFNSTNAVVTNIDDPLLGKSTSGFFPSIAAGFYYLSSTREYRDNAFYLGFAYHQAYQSNIIIDNINQKRYSHLVIDFGTKIYGYSGYFEPSLSINYVAPEILNFQLGGKYEVKDAFWAGLGYSSVNDVNIQGGFILDDFGGRDGKLRLGLLANANMTSTIQDFGPGLELFARYEFDLD